MFSLKGEKVWLRALEPEDLDFLYQIENDESIWEVSHTIAPYSKWVLKQYLANAQQDIYESKQLRLVICNYENEIVGLIDLFDFEPHHKRAGLGILVHTQQRNGYATEALQLVLNYGFSFLGINQVYVNISEDNHLSINLFEKFNFELIGVKKDWNYVNGQFKNERMYQLINPKKNPFENR